MGLEPNHSAAIRYRGFILLPHSDNSWLVRPERSPMSVLPFKTGACSLTELKEKLDLQIEESFSHEMAA